jgi:hypothetical protein
MPNRIVGVVIACSLVAAGHAVAQVAPELRDAMRARDEATRKKDVATWDRLTTADFTVVDETGKLLTKAERIAELKTEKPEGPPVVQDEQVTRYGDTIIRRYRNRLGAWVLTVWVKDGSTWRVAAAQVTNSAKK